MMTSATIFIYFLFPIGTFSGVNFKHCVEISLRLCSRVPTCWGGLRASLRAFQSVQVHVCSLCICLHRCASTCVSACFCNVWVLIKAFLWGLTAPLKELELADGGIDGTNRCTHFHAIEGTGLFVRVSPAVARANRCRCWLIIPAGTFDYSRSQEVLQWADIIMTFIRSLHVTSAST